jgi:hypothetical protein
MGALSPERCGAPIVSHGQLQNRLKYSPEALLHPTSLEQVQVPGWQGSSSERDMVGGWRLVTYDA